MSAADLSVDLGGMALRNPVLTASGTFGYGTEFAPYLDLRTIGGFVAKSLTLEPRSGNPPPRIHETPAGMLNAIGLENVGVDAFIREKLPALPDGVPVVASVFGTQASEYAEVCKRLSGVPGVVGLEINASCPNVAGGGDEFGQNATLLRELVGSCRAATSEPLMIKLSPNVTHIGEMARICEGEGADAVSLINTLRAMEVDVETRRPALGNVTGGLSGPAIRPVALHMVRQAHLAVDIPICGMGGITDAEDALKFLLCGATAVQVGTAGFLDPTCAGRVVEGIEAYCERHGIARVRDLVGALELSASN